MELRGRKRVIPRLFHQSFLFLLKYLGFLFNPPRLYFYIQQAYSSKSLPRDTQQNTNGGESISTYTVLNYPADSFEDE